MSEASVSSKARTRPVMSAPACSSAGPARPSAAAARPASPGVKSADRVDGLLEDEVWFRDGQGLDLEPAPGRDEYGDPGRFAVDRQADVELARDGKRFFDEDTADDAARRPGLRGGQGPAEQARRGRCRVGGCGRFEDASGQAPAAG